jgi:ABC-type amino acid transport system permease subunit
MLTRPLRNDEEAIIVMKSVYLTHLRICSPLSSLKWFVEIIVEVFKNKPPIISCLCFFFGRRTNKV